MSVGAGVTKRGYVDPKVPIAERPVFHGKEDLRRMYLECFELEDKYFLNFEYGIVVDQSVPPKVHAPRRVPIELKTSCV